MADLREQTDLRTVRLNGVKAAGRLALVDDEDYELVMTRKWHISPGKRPDTVYALATIRVNGRQTCISMHNLITDWPITDHINGDGLDNRRANLRPATSAQNSWNSKPRKGASRFKGVYINQQGKWAAAVRAEGKPRYLGMFKTEIDAALAYDAAAREAFGEFARPNFPDGKMTLW